MKNKNLMYILVFGCCCLMYGGSIGIACDYGLFFQPMADMLNVSFGQVTLHTTIQGIASACSVIFVGTIFERFKHRDVYLLGMALIMGSSYLIANATSINMVYVYVVFRGIGYTLCSTIVLTMIINNWFVKYRATLLGISFASSGIVGAIVSPIISTMLTSLGFKMTYIIANVVVILSVLPAALFIPLKPETVGMKPFGFEPGDEAIMSSKPASKDKKKGMNVPAKSLAFIFSYGLAITATSTMASLMPSFVVSAGYTSIISASILSVMMIANITFKVLSGIIIDRFGAQITSGIYLFGNMLGLLAIFFLNKSLALLYVGAFLYSTSYANGSVGSSNVILSISGPDDFSKVSSLNSFVVSMFSSIFLSVCGFIFDATGNYTIQMIIILSCSVIAQVLIWGLYGKVAKGKRRTA